MLSEKTSKHVGTATELACLLQIKPGFLPTLDTRTYATRLRVVFKVLQTLRSASREIRTLKPVVDIVDAARTVHSFSWAIIAERQLLLNVTFDGPWEPYIRVIWRDLGPLLDLFLCNCERFVPSTEAFEPFAQFVRDHQIETAFFYPSSSLSVDDQRYLVEFERQQRHSPQSFPERATQLVAEGAERQAARDRELDPAEARIQWVTALEALHGLRGFFPGEDDTLLHRAAVALLRDSNPFEEGAEPALPAAAWFFRREPEGVIAPRRALEPTEIQGGILEPYKRISHGCLLLARVEEPAAARAFIGSLAGTITTEKHAAATQDDRGSTETYLNVAFTANGLANLGVGASQLRRFPKEFRDGMEARAGLLGDIRQNHPDHWTLPAWNVESGAGSSADRPLPPIRMSSVDLAVTFHKRGRWDATAEWNGGNPLHGEVQTFCAAALEHGIRVLHVEPLRRISHKRGETPGGMPTDHFNFVDGISQPKASELPRGNEVEFGDLLVGFRNSRKDGDFPESQAPEALRGSLFDQGSFLVIRKLRQDVVAFEAAIERLTKSGDFTADELLAKIMGRSRDGSPVLKPGGGPTNDFDFSGDAAGKGCPFHAHIRRANPRVRNDQPGVAPPIVPRIARRGLSYGPLFTKETAGAERGMMFMAYNASIAEQFEIIQRWMSAGNTPTSTNGASTYGGQPDPIVGLPDVNGSKWFRFVNGDRVHHVDLGPKPFVTLQWGLYLFAPSIPALRLIARDPVPDVASAERMVEVGRRVIDGLRSQDQWTAALEDISAVISGTTAAIYAAIRQNHNGVLRTPYGVIVASHARGMEVLTRDDVFSVSEYQNRFRRSVGEGYLGMDAGAEYERLSQVPNAALDLVTQAAAREAAYEVTGKVLHLRIEEAVARARAIRSNEPKHPNISSQPSVPLPLEPVISDALGHLAQQWFDVPDGVKITIGGEFPPSNALRCPFTFLAPSRYVFSTPHPRPEQVELGTRNGASLLKAVEEFVVEKRRCGSPPSGVIARRLFERIKDDNELARMLLGLVFGFVPTVYGSLLAVLGLWLSDETLWRVQQVVRGIDASLAERAAGLQDPLERAMQTRPVPPLLHRTATKDTKLGNVEVAAGDRVVVAITGMTHDLLFSNRSDVKTIFGGDRSAGTYPNRPLHACPGYPIARGVIEGVLLAILDVPVLRPAPAQITVRVTLPPP
jgi:deferrochelatase/peroxidase EfeB